MRPNFPSWKCTLLTLACAIVALPSARADEPTPDPARPLLDEAREILLNLQQKKTFVQPYGSESLLAQLAALQYQINPRHALDIARELSEPFYASLALGAIASQCIKTDPETAQQLILGAQEHALSIHHYTGSDPTSLNYLFQLTPSFPHADARKLLTASRRNLNQWLGTGAEIAQPMLELARQTIALDPDGVESLVNEAPHNWESMQLLGTHLAHTKKEWAAQQVVAFYKSGKPWPGTSKVLFALVIDDALRDLPAALQKIKTMHEEHQDEAHFYVARALRDAGRFKEFAAIIDDLQSRIDTKAPHSRWIAGVLPTVREGWAAREQRAKEPASGPVTPAQIDAFLAKPDLDVLRLHIVGLPLHFRDVQQAQDFLAAALPHARQVTDFLGYPRHGSPKSVALGTFAQLAASLNKPDQAKAIADEINIPELRAFYLMIAFETIHPLPPVTRDWPIYFCRRVTVKIGP